MEEVFIKELDQIEFNCCDPIRFILSSLQNKAKVINQMKSEIKNTNKYESNLQTFLSIREIQEKTTEFEKDLQSCIENEFYETTYIELTMNTTIQDILNVERFVFINFKKIPSSKIELNGRKKRQAQVIVSKPILSINDIKLQFKRKLNTPCRDLAGCCVTSKGELIVTDNQPLFNEKVIAKNDKGEVEYTIFLKEPYRSFDVTSLDVSTIAVSTGHSFNKHGIILINLDSRKLIKFNALPGCPYGITYDGSFLICCVDRKDIHVVSCTDYSISTIPNTYLPKYSYVSTYNGKIFYTNPMRQNVTCCSYNGVLIWEFKNESILRFPHGIAIDINGNICVVGYCSCNLVIISPNGKECNEILTNKDGLNSLKSIFLDKVKNQFLVTNEKHFANIFNVSYF